MRAIKIDVVTKEVYIVDISGDNVSMNKELDSDGFDMIRLSRTECLWVDDTGLRRKPPLGAFTFDGYPQALPGHGLIIGLRGDDNASTKLSVEEVRAAVQFVDVSELPFPVISILDFETVEDFEKYMRGKSTGDSKPSKN